MLSLRVVLKLVATRPTTAVSPPTQQSKTTRRERETRGYRENNALISRIFTPKGCPWVLQTVPVMERERHVCGSVRLRFGTKEASRAGRALFILTGRVGGCQEGGPGNSHVVPRGGERGRKERWVKGWEGGREVREGERERGKKGKKKKGTGCYSLHAPASAPTKIHTCLRRLMRELSIIHMLYNITTFSIKKSRQMSCPPNASRSSNRLFGHLLRNLLHLLSHMQIVNGPPVLLHCPIFLLA